MASCFQSKMSKQLSDGKQFNHQCDELRKQCAHFCLYAVAIIIVQPINKVDFYAKFVGPGGCGS
jgi:hypothetical protein